MEHKKMDSDSSHPSGDDSVARFGSEHTPGPWVIALGDETAIERADKTPIAQVQGDYETDYVRMAADAARIVQCVNAHDELVTALEKLTHYAECQVKTFSTGRCYLDMTLFPRLCMDARAAIARATGAPQ